MAQSVTVMKYRGASGELYDHESDADRSIAAYELGQALENLIGFPYGEADINNVEDGLIKHVDTFAPILNQIKDLKER